MSHKTKSIIILWLSVAFTTSAAVMLWVMPVDRWSTFFATLGFISYELDKVRAFYEKSLKP